MNKIKENPIKYVRLFTLIYLIVNVITRIVYYSALSIIHSFDIEAATILGITISLIPTILFIIYVFLFYGAKKSQILLPISYFVSIVINLFSLIQNIHNMRYIHHYSSFEQALRYGIVDDILNILFSVVGLCFAVFLLTTCLNNFKTLKTAKKIVIFNAVVSIFPFLLGIILNLAKGYSYNLSLLFIFSSLVSLSPILSHFAYIIFWNFAVEKRNVSPLEYDLVSLKQRYEKGEITEEEYNNKRADILNSL